MTSSDPVQKAPEIEVYIDMIRARKMEEAISSLFDKRIASGTTHLGIGQEAVSVGVISQLARDDYVVGTYRGHIAALAKGVSMSEIVAEVLGKANGSNRGYGGSMHLTKESVGLIANFSVVGAGIPVAMGLGLAAKLREEERIAVCFFGDGATNNGYFYETMNMAAVLGSRVLFAVENNLYSEHTSRSETTKVEEIPRLVREFGVHAETSGGNDVEEVMNSAREAIARIRSTNEPSLIEFKTYRTTGHSQLDTRSAPESAKDREEWLSRDPIAMQRKRLLGNGSLSAELEAQLLKQIDEEVRDAVQAALGAPWPDLSGLNSSLFAGPDKESEVAPAGEQVQTSMRSAINAALRQSMELDPRILVLGEDVGKWGGVYKVTEGLSEKFGPKRVFDTPISEGSIAGMALGLSLAHLRPVVEIMFSDFLFMAMDAIGNGIAKKRWLSGGVTSVPLVIRTACGSQTGWGATHTQVLDNLLAATPGIRVLTPSNAYDAKGLLCAALAGQDPVVFFEHKRLYQASAPVPEDYFTLPIGKARVAREGDDITIVSNMAMLVESLKAAELLMKNNVSAEVVDLRTIVPLDKRTILSSVMKTGGLVVVDESPKSAGWSNRVGSLVAEECLYSLQHPVKRVGSPDLPLPFSPHLEKELIPSSETIADACLKALKE